MRKNNYALWVITAIVALNSIGLSIVLPLLPFLIGEYLPPQQVAGGMGALLAVFAACSFLSAPVFGALSDRYGRKRILLISLLGSVVGYILFGIGGSLGILFLGRIIDGLTAGNISILFAYVSDSTRPEERAKWFSYISAAMGIGKIGGPALGGMLGSIAIGLPFYITAGCILLSAVAVYCFLPESLEPEQRSERLSLRSFNTFSHFRNICRLQGVRLLLVIGGCFFTALSIFQFNFTVLLKDIYHWSPAFIGVILTFVGICEIGTRAVVLPRLLDHFSQHRIGKAGLQLFGSGLGLLLCSLYIHSAILIALAVVCIISGEGLLDPTYNGALSSAVSESQQGRLQGVNQSLLSLINVFVPLLAAAIYFYSPAALYLTATGILFVSVGLYFYLPTR